jgi:hypothetical protein
MSFSNTDPERKVNQSRADNQLRTEAVKSIKEQLCDESAIKMSE